MNGPMLESSQGEVEPAMRGHCTVDGCGCKDVRILLRRRAAFFADFARRRGETANRVIAPEFGWAIPQSGLLR